MAELGEPSNQPLFATVLDQLVAAPGTALLDVGCGSGYAARMADARGAVVTGIDVTPELLEIARERVPAGRFVLAGLEALPFADQSIDAAVGFNVFQFAADPVGAVGETARVVRPGGR